LGGSLIGELSGLPVFTDLLLQADVLRSWVHKVPLLDMFAVQIGDLDVDIAQMIVPRVTTSEDITMPLELRNLPNFAISPALRPPAFFLTVKYQVGSL
jgi:hypothetical protein